MAPFGRRLVSVSIEGAWIRILGTRGNEVEYWAEIPIDESWLEGGVIRDTASIGHLVGDTFRLRALPREHVVAAIPGMSAVSRIIAIPKIPGNLNQTIEQEARRVFPDLNAGMNLYWQAIDPRGSPIQRVFVVATPRDLVLNAVEMLRIAGIQPISLDLKPLALYRAVARQEAIIANRETTALEIVVVVDDLPVLIRAVSLDGMSSAELFHGRVTDELTRTIRLYNDANRAKPLDPAAPVVLSGDQMDDRALAARIQTLTGHEVAPADPPIAYPDDFPVARFLVNAGLALKRL